MDQPNKPTSLKVVIGSLDSGGAERHLLQVLPRLARLGFSVSVYCLRIRGELADEMERQGVAVFGRSHYSTPLGLRHLGVLWRGAALFFHLLRHRPQIVQFFLPAAYILGAPSAVLARCRIRIMSRRSQNNYQKQLLWSSYIERQWHRRMSAVFGNSRSVVDQLREEGVPENKLHLVYNGIDLSAYDRKIPRETARNRLGISNEALTFVIVANLIHYKGHIDLLRAFARIKDQLPENWVLLCAGRDDGIGASLQNEVERLGLSQRIHWLGSVKDIPSLLAASDIALLTSHEEGFSNAIIEYMAAGLPSIVTDVGGNSEAVSHEETGLVVPARDPTELSSAILRLASDSALRQHFGSAAQKIAHQQYSIDACVTTYANIYTKILREHGIDWDSA